MQQSQILCSAKIEKRLLNDDPGYNGKWHLRFLGLALQVASWSKDPSTKVGATIADKHNKIVALGYNGFARGCLDDPKLYNDRASKYPRVVHAEVNAILNANKPVKGCTLYSTFFPCPTCTAILIQAGISEVISLRNPAADERYEEAFQHSRQMLNEAGISWHIVDLKLGLWIQRHNYAHHYNAQQLAKKKAVRKPKFKVSKRVPKK